MIIAIDGPSASGKSTIAKKVAEKLKVEYLDTGAMYRALTWKAIVEKIDVTSEEALVNLARRVRITFSGSGINQRVFIDSQDASEEIRLPKVSSLVSVVSKVSEVRRIMVKKQRELVGSKNTVVEGRDIGIVVFPEAEVKIFLTATPVERARRRQIELEDEGHKFELATVKREIVSRDAIDSTRSISPLKCSPEAKVIDTTDKSIEEVVLEILDEIARR